MSQMPQSSTSTPSDVTDNDKLMALLAYLLTPLGPAIVLLSESNKARPYQKYHAVQALGLFGAEVIYLVVACILITICSAVLTATVVGVIVVPCLSLFFLVPLAPDIWYAYLAYTKKSYFDIPVLTNFMIQQKWLTKPG